MSVKYKIFPIPIINPEDQENVLNQFLCTHKIISIHKEIVKEISGHYVCFVVEYLDNKNDPPAVSKGSKNTIPEKKDRIDYREILSADDFQLYLRLKDWRKLIGEQNDNIPLYNIFTNEQLAQICQKKVNSKNELKKIPGVGDVKVDKYSNDVFKIVSEHLKNYKTPPVQDNIKQGVSSG
ncbi:MAG: HRDC domain-containing protein [Candidatus Magnetomorum sp.]|nr:HRDC domain-containing protein [Candidatus Magnetomorum sp.]